MGLSSNRSYNLTRQFKARLDDIFSAAISMMKTHKEIIEGKSNQIYNDCRYKKLPAHSKEYLRGYADARMNELYRHHIEWRLYVAKDKVMGWRFLGASNATDGNLLLSKAEIAWLQNTHDNENIYSFFDTDKSCHTWKGRPDKPFDSVKGTKE